MTAVEISTTVSERHCLTTRPWIVKLDVCDPFHRSSTSVFSRAILHCLDCHATRTLYWQSSQGSRSYFKTYVTLILIWQTLSSPFMLLQYGCCGRFSVTKWPKKVRLLLCDLRSLHERGAHKGCRNVRKCHLFVSWCLTTFSGTHLKGMQMKKKRTISNIRICKAKKLRIKVRRTEFLWHRKKLHDSTAKENIFMPAYEDI